MEITTTRAHYFDTTSQLKPMRISHKVDVLIARKLGEHKTVDGLLGEVRVGEILCPWHQINIHLIDEGLQPTLQTTVQ